MGLAYCAQTKRVIAGSFQGEVLVWDSGKPDSVGKLNANPPPISERIIDVHQQWLAALKGVDGGQLKLRNHDTTLEQIAAEIREAGDKFADMQKKIGDAKSQVVSTKKETQVAKAKLKELEQRLAKQDTSNANEGKRNSENNKAESRQTRKQLKAQRRRVKELEQQTTVLNNRIVGWDGAATVTQTRVAELQKENGRLKDLRKPLATQFETSRAEANRLNKVLDFWKAEADFAKRENK